MSGFDKSKLFFVPMLARVEEMEVSASAVRDAINFALEQASLRNGETAAADPVGPNQQPRMLQISAWLCHAFNETTGVGEPNKNQRAFTEEDLQEAVANGLFKAPFFGMIDYNHDFQTYGCFYDAAYAWDENAKAYGILVKGAIFAWRWTELADRLLAEQARHGGIKVSMSCLPAFYEPAKTVEALFARKPVFFTGSVLDIPPADDKADALVSEDPANTNEMRAAELLNASLVREADNKEANAMDPVNVSTETEAPALEAAEVAAEVVAESPEAAVEVAAEVPAEVPVETAAEVVAEEPAVEVTAETVETAAEAPVEAAVEPAVETPAADTPVVPETAALETQVADLRTQLGTASVALSAAEQTVATLTAEVETLRAFKATVEAERLAVETAARREQRRNEIPATVLASISDKDGTVREEHRDLFNEWMDQPEDKWALSKKLFAVASAGRKTFAERSAEEGSLSSVSDNAEGADAISRWRRRR